MTALNPRLRAKTDGLAPKENTLEGPGYRLSVLTPNILRVETGDEAGFADRATQRIWRRNFGKVDFKVVDGPCSTIVETSECKFAFSKILKRATRIYLKSEKVWAACSNRGNLRGTRRTLDMCQGRVRLGKGVLSKRGVAVLRDDGLILEDDGSLRAREGRVKDLYVFAFGREYQKALDGYFALTGPTPMLPRYALGNWWSRYYAYDQAEYMRLMERFEKENVPISVATVDMDWHWVKVNEKFNGKFTRPRNILTGPGWTGYSWNTDLFPDYRRFLAWLKERNLRVTLNVHPSLGVRRFEDMYEEMARRTGIDPASGADVAFDISNPDFVNAYFDVLHHPYEKDGVDFWWIDWQQGRKSSIKGVDPLWALNHYHYCDSARENRRGLILSRYCGIGAHRYPIGFSGDCISKWSSLNFQPEFTNTAANIGYDWWSHDIGGHNFGYCDDEMYLRWCQYGAFSPINRLHSTMFPLQGKEPWKRSETTRRIVSDFLRLRHALIPYIYSAGRATAEKNVALCRPMYHLHPREAAAYSVPNQYMFGDELMVAPITRRAKKRLRMAQVKVWLPEGRHTDIFTDRVYEGGRTVVMSRDPEHIPVLAKAGAIVPMSLDPGNGCANPTRMKVLAYRGNNSYSLYEDDGETQSGASCVTRFEISEGPDGRASFAIRASEGDLSVLPKNRRITVCFKDIASAKATVDGAPREFSGEIELEIDPTRDTAIELRDCVPLANADCFESVNEIFSRYDAGNLNKMIRYFFIDRAARAADKEKLKKAIRRSLFPRYMKLAALERIE